MVSDLKKEIHLKQGKPKTETMFPAIAQHTSCVVP